MKRKWHFFGMPVIPFLLLLVLSISMVLFNHHRVMTAMRNDVEKSRLRLTGNVANGIGTLLEQVSMNATGLALQLDKAVSFKSQSLAMYNNTIEQLVNMQVNNESMLNPIISRGYVFLFDENRAFNTGSTVYKGDEFYEKYLRISNGTYEEFRSYYTQNYFGGDLIPDVEIGYLDEIHQGWLVAQSVPADPGKKARGVILFLVNTYDLQQRLMAGVADDESLCMLADESGAIYLAQGDRGLWTKERASSLLEQLPEHPQGSFHLRTANGEEHLVTAAENNNNLFIIAQPVKNAERQLTYYNLSVLLTCFSILLIAAAAVARSTHRSVQSAQTAMDSILPENQPENAANIFEYMRKAILSAQEKEALLSAHANQQQELLRTIFLKRLLRGEFLLESDLLREQHLAGFSLNGTYYVVLIIHFWQPDALSAESCLEIERILTAEFGRENIRIAKMPADDLVCLLVSEEPDLRESIEPAAETFSAHWNVTCFVGSTVTQCIDIPRSYREAYMMIRMYSEGSGAVIWYCDLFQDDAMYNFEYSQYVETKLRNTITVGNAHDAEQILDDLYQNNVKNGARSAHVLRFFAYDLYRMINHIGGSAEDGKEKNAYRLHLQEMMDSVIDHPQNFDNFFAEIKQFCLKMCRQNHQRQQKSRNEVITQVQEYINSAFSNPLLSVGSIAEQFKLSDKYLSQLFREQTGETISSYIESKRLGHACKLLDSTSMTVNEVALAAGYALTHAFRVAFKKKTGITPLQWKNRTDKPTV